MKALVRNVPSQLAKESVLYLKPSRYGKMPAVMEVTVDLAGLSMTLSLRRSR